MTTSLKIEGDLYIPLDSIPMIAEVTGMDSANAKFLVKKLIYLCDRSRYHDPHPVNGYEQLLSDDMTELSVDELNRKHSLGNLAFQKGMGKKRLSFVTELLELFAEKAE